MTYSQGEIIYALNLIQNVCKEQPNCYSCPFSGKDGDIVLCRLFHSTPVNWHIKNEEVWRAFQ